jgi:cytochrome c-type protein NapB
LPVQQAARLQEVRRARGEGVYLMAENLPSSEHYTADDLLPSRLRRFVPLVAAIGIGIALVGFITGIREPEPTKRQRPAADALASDAPAAVPYVELPTARIRANANWEQSLSQLKFEKPGIFEPVVRTEAMKLAALQDRLKNRAFDGAPPTIPHPVEARSAASCLACHGDGLKVGDRIASPISHAHLTNCTQCHVEQLPVGVSDTFDSPGNGFVGLYRAGPGERASPGAPPTIPHQTWMRENCASCHGLVARPGIRTTHPWLSSCTQCHAPSAARDQVQFPGGNE